MPYFNIGLFFLLALIFGVGLLALSHGLGLLSKNAAHPTNLDPYECGVKPLGSARVRFNIKFYLVAMLFILFDIEAAFLYPWARSFRSMVRDPNLGAGYVMAEVFVFLGILLAGYVYVWRVGIFDWARSPRRMPKPKPGKLPS